jgi:hypothetical protein
MIRTQIQLTEEQQEMLRGLSAETGWSIADLIRKGIDRLGAYRPRADRREMVERAARLAGRYSSGKPDVSAAHDKHLAEAFK